MCHVLDWEFYLLIAVFLWYVIIIKIPLQNPGSLGLNKFLFKII